MAKRSERLLLWCILTSALSSSIAFHPSLDRKGSTLLVRKAAPQPTAATAYTLEKPLGLILEEVEEGQSAGVFVKEVGEGGSAFAYAESIAGSKLSTVQGEDVTALSFDDVMEKIMSAPDSVDISFAVQEKVQELEVGTPVSIVVKQDGKPDLPMSVKVGDNLRQALLDNGFEVYQGMKQKLGNCGGGGQCTFCAMDFLESEGWSERSDYEDERLKNLPNARLSCLNNVQGPAVIQKAKR